MYTYFTGAKVVHFCRSDYIEIDERYSLALVEEAKTVAESIIQRTSTRLKLPTHKDNISIVQGKANPERIPVQYVLRIFRAQ